LLKYGSSPNALDGSRDRHLGFSTAGPQARPREPRSSGEGKYQRLFDDGGIDLTRAEYEALGRHDRKAIRPQGWGARGLRAIRRVLLDTRSTCEASRRPEVVISGEVVEAPHGRSISTPLAPKARRARLSGFAGYETRGTRRCYPLCGTIPLARVETPVRFNGPVNGLDRGLYPPEILAGRSVLPRS